MTYVTVHIIPEDQIEELFEEGTNNQVYIQPVPTKKSIFNIQPRINLYQRGLNRLRYSQLRQAPKKKKTELIKKQKEGGRTVKSSQPDEHKWKSLTCLEYIRILSNSLRSANAATTFGVALALIYIFRARSLSTVYKRIMTAINNKNNGLLA